jgi:DNA mismatch repair protein MSH3
MAPPTKPPKKQQSLTSFFSPKSTPASQASQKAKQAAHPLSSSPIRAEGNKMVQGRKRPLEEDLDKENSGSDLVKRVKSVGEDSNRAGLEVADEVAATAKTGSQRTDVYLFDSSQSELVDPTRLKEREELHRRFVRKLGHPDSLARRPRGGAGEDAGEGEEGEEDGEEEEEAPAPKKSAKGKGKNKLTPMEIQFLEIKRKHMDTVLIVEVGYKFKFFGEDARIASKVLSIVCIPGKMRFDERKLESSRQLCLSNGG